MGYKLINDGSKYFRAKPIYRDSGNATSLRVSRRNGWFTDYSANITGPLTDLVKLTLGLKNTDDAKSWLANNEFELNSINVDESPLIERSTKIYNKEMLDKLIRNHQYWNDRGVSTEILEKHKGGVALSGVLYGRYVFPVFDQIGRLIGFAGRDITNKSPIKWKIIGPKHDFIFPFHNIENIREKKEVILLESIGDLLSLEGAGIYTGLVLFGVKLSDTILSKLSGLMPQKIIIALNNDQNNGNVGQKSAEEMGSRLLHFFNPEVIQIKIPIGYGDLGEMSPEAVLEWYNLKSNDEKL